jgi:HD-GYP domain-containing protein (c-di-GMP phosphodiesterase class II)
VGHSFDEMVSRLDENESELRRFAENVVSGLALAVDAKDAYTHAHSLRVADYAAAIARELGLRDEHLSAITTVGRLHDVGKIAIPDSVLLKPTRLSDDEYELVKTHAAEGERLVAGAGMTETARWIRHHHERFDGRGYPDGLAGEAIPLERRILAVADAVEAMTSDRYYRAALGVDRALDELRAGAGSQFDPVVVAAVEDAVSSGRLAIAAAPSLASA